jgi:hypothetical protein
MSTSARCSRDSRRMEYLEPTKNGHFLVISRGSLIRRGSTDPQGEVVRGWVVPLLALVLEEELLGRLARHRILGHCLLQHLREHLEVLVIDFHLESDLEEVENFSGGSEKFVSENQY